MFACSSVHVDLWCTRRFDPSLRRLKARVDAGEVGDVLSVKSIARDHPFPPIDYLKISGDLALTRTLVIFYVNN